METNENTSEKLLSDLLSQTFYHGTKADLKTGDLIEIGFNSNYGQQKTAKSISPPLWKPRFGAQNSRRA